MDLEILYLEYQQAQQKNPEEKGERFFWERVENLFRTMEKYQRALEKIAFYHPNGKTKGPKEYDRRVTLLQEIAIRALEK